MSIASGDKVKIRPLNDRPGRIVGSQPTPKSRVIIYLVRYEIENGPNRRSESSLFFEDELLKA